MLRGIYTAAAGMISNTINTDTMAHNLANVNTAGFKKSAVNFQQFPDMLLQRLHNGETTPIGKISNGMEIMSTAILHQQGDLRQTGNPLDMGLQGDGFFEVKNLDGDSFYTRNGQFTISPDGYLVTQEGNFLQGKLGNIRVQPSGAQVNIDKLGTVYANGTPLDQLKITQFNSNYTLERLGDSLYKTTEQSQILDQPVGGSGTLVHQGMLEGSNVSVVGEMVNSITGMRLYESLQRSIKTQDNSLQKLISDVGRFM